jgi:UDP-2,3-diacylglucosamine hydrolase
MWMRNYFQKELNISLYFEQKTFEWNGKRLLVAHGDGLGPEDHGYKFMKSIFRNPFCQWLFGLLHPSWGIGIANYFSKKSRNKTSKHDEHFLGEDREWLIIFSRGILAKEHYDYFIFGHRHLPLDIRLTDKSRYINLGDWITYFTYAEFDGQTLQLKYYS